MPECSNAEDFAQRQPDAGSARDLGALLAKYTRNVMACGTGSLDKLSVLVRGRVTTPDPSQEPTRIGVALSAWRLARAAPAVIIGLAGDAHPGTRTPAQAQVRMPMYVPGHFSEQSDEVMHALIRACPLGLLVVAGAGGLEANHIPFLLSVADGGRATLLGHVTKANPVWRTPGPSTAALVVFQGPAGYISPGWYPSKLEHGRVVPTWSYAAVHAQGTVTFHDDPHWTRKQMEWLTHQMEAGREHPWAVADAPADYVDRLVANVVGVEIVVERLTGKWKVSQNQSDANRAGVVKGLQDAGGPAAAELARLVAEHPGVAR